MADIEDTGFGIGSITLRDDSIGTISNPNTVINILSSIHPVFSSDGKDNKLVEMSDLSEVLTQYGADFTDLNKYGQQNLNAEQVLSNGGTVYLCRLLPDNARTAHLVIKIGVKAVQSIPLYKRDIYGNIMTDEKGNKVPVTVDRITGGTGRLVTKFIKIDTTAIATPDPETTYYKLVKVENPVTFDNMKEYYTKDTDGNTLAEVDNSTSPVPETEYFNLELLEGETFETDAEYYTIVTTREGEMEGVETSKVQAFTSGISFKVIVDHANSEDDYRKFSTGKKMSSKFSVIPEGVDEDGYKIFPLEYIYYYANGKCGNNYGIRIINDFARDEKVDDGRRYQMFLVKKNSTGYNTLSIGNGISFSFNPEARVSKKVTSLEGLQKAYSNLDGATEKQIQIDYYQNNYTALMEEIERILSEEPVISEGVDLKTIRTPSSVNDVDFMYGYAKDQYTFDNVLIDENSVDLSVPVYMSGGSDGDFDNLTGEALQNSKEELLSKFFNGDIDTANLLDVLRCDGGIIYDANYSMDIKSKMVQLIKYRRDICMVFDCGDTDNILDAVNISGQIRSNISTGGENFAIIPHTGVTTNRDVNVHVTGTYEFAGGITSLYRKSPFSLYAGKKNDAGCVKSMIFDWIVEETKPKGYYVKLAKDNSLYYAVDFGKAVSTFAIGNTTGRNVYFYSDSNLYNEKISKLAEFRNGVLTNDIRRILKLTLCKYTFDTDGAESAMDSAREDLVKRFSSRYPSNIIITLNLYQTQRDALLKNATCEVTVTFPDVFETWNCTISASRNGVTEE